MKKLIAILMGIVMCLSLVACGGKSAEKAFVGEWISDMDVHLIVKDDGTCYIDDTEYKWSYDKNTDMYTVYAELPITFCIEEENDMRFFDAWGVTKYYHADDLR